MQGDPDSTPAPAPRVSIPLSVYHSSYSSSDGCVEAATPPNGGVKVEIYTIQKCDGDSECGGEVSWFVL